MIVAPTLRAVVLAALGVPLAMGIVALAPGAWLTAVIWPLFVLLAVLADGVLGALAFSPALTRTPSPSLEVGRAQSHVFPLERVVDTLEAKVETSQWLDAEPLARPGEQPAFRLRATRRGTRRIEALHLRWLGPLGLAAQVRRLPLGREVPVNVDLGSVREEALVLATEGLIGESEQRRRGQGSEFNSLRAWTQGMDRRSIDWKHSARHGELVAREMRDEQNQTVAIVIDSGRTMVEPLEPGGLSRLDHAVAAGLLTAFVALKRGDAAALFAIDSRPRVKTGLVTGARGFPAITKAAARIEYSAHETNFTRGLAAVGPVLKRRSLVICFTEIVDPTSAQLMVESTARLLKDHYVLFVVLKNEAVEEAADRKPEDVGDIGRAVVAGSLLRTRLEVFAKLRRIGVEVLEVGAKESPAQLVRRYLEIKKRGLV